MLNLLRAEWTKLRSTASFWWTSGLNMVLAALYGALFGWTARLSTMPYIPVTVIATVALTSAIVMVVQQSMIVTTEYRYGIPSTNFRIAPRRWQVAAAKLVLGAVIAAATTLVGLVLAFVLADALSPVPASWATNPATQRALWAVPLGMALVSLFTQGIGWLVRNTAGAVVVGLGMLLVVDSIVGLIPKWGPEVSKYLPFGNLIAFMTNQPAHGFSAATSLGIFTVWAVALWAAGVAVLTARDA